MTFRPLLVALPFVLAACGVPASTPADPAARTETPPEVVIVRINMSEEGFAPASVTAALGSTVTFVNVGEGPMRPASDPYPEHTDLPGFDSVVEVGPGSTYSFTFTRAGTWGFHDHLNPNRTGSVTVTAEAETEAETDDATNE